MKGKAKQLLRYFSGIIIPIISIILCLTYDDLIPTFKFLWLNLLLPFYLFFVNFLFGKNEKTNKIFDSIVSILTIIVSCAVCILFVYSRYTFYYNSEYYFIDYEMRFFIYKKLIFMLLFSIGVLLIMVFLFILKQNMKNGNSKNIGFSIIVLTTTCIFTVVVFLNHLGMFSLYDNNQCENLCRTMLYEIFNTQGEYNKCDHALKKNISEDLYKSIYNDYIYHEKNNYKETYAFNCIGTEIICNIAKVSYTYSYQQKDKNGKLVFGSAADVYNSSIMTLKKINNRWIVTDNNIHV